MKIKIKRSFFDKEKDFKQGETVDVAEDTAKFYVSQGWASKVGKEEKIETASLKQGEKRGK